MDAKEFLKTVCEFYNFEITETQEGITVDNFDGYKETFNTHEEALKDQLGTMKETNEDDLQNETINYITWSKHEIKFIESL